jgi:hypothetical protein
MALCANVFSDIRTKLQLNLNPVSIYTKFWTVSLFFHLVLEHFLQYLRMQLPLKLAHIGFCLELAEKLLV